MFYVAKVRVFDAFSSTTGQYRAEDEKNPCSSIYNLVHLKKEEITLSWLGMKVLESFAGHAKNILGRHYLRAEV